MSVDFVGEEAVRTMPLIGSSVSATETTMARGKLNRCFVMRMASFHTSRATKCAALPSTRPASVSSQTTAPRVITQRRLGTAWFRSGARMSIPIRVESHTPNSTTEPKAPYP